MAKDVIMRGLVGSFLFLASFGFLISCYISDLQTFVNGPKLGRCFFLKDAGMWIETDSIPTLDTPDVHHWILHAAPGIPFDAPDPTQSGMVLASKRSFIPTSTDVNGAPLTLFAMQREHYTLSSRKRYIGTFDVNVRTEQPVTLTAVACLLTKPNLPNQAAIIALLQNYDAVKDGDPTAYAARHLSATITADMFTVLMSYNLARNGASIPHTEERDAKIRFLAGGSQGNIGSESWEDYHKDNQLLATLISTIDIDTPVPTPSDPHEQDVSDPSNPDPSIIDSLVRQDSKGMKCDITGPERRQIFSVLQWPEFKVSWHDVRIDIGCGFHVIVTLPYPQTRVGSLVLWGYLGHDSQVVKALLNQVISALIAAAEDAVVVGLITMDYYAAAAAFAAAFEQKVLLYAGRDIACLVPGIALLHAHTAWVP